MAIYYLLLILTSIAHTSPVSRNESNILRIGKSRDPATVATKERAKGENSSDELNDYKEERQASKVGDGQVPLSIGFGKNNPELDWKNYLRLIEGDEQRDKRHDIDFMGDKVGTTANSIQWLADLYDPLKWSRVPGKLGKDCRKELEFFLESLRDGKLWAAKSE